MFYDILERKKKHFVDYKNRKFKGRKLDLFSKVLVHGFGS